MGLITGIIGAASAIKGISDIFGKKSTSNDKFGDSLGVLNKYSDSIQSLFGSGGDSTPDYEYLASLQNQMNEKSVRDQLQANKELANYSFQLNKSQVDNQNAYNSPEQQMQRLKDAGLNPALMYGNGVTASATGNQSETAKHTAPQASKVDYINSKMLELQMLKMYQDVRLSQAQVESVDLANENARVSNRVARRSEDEVVKAYEIQNLVANKEMSFKDGLIAINEQRKETEYWNTEYTKWKSSGQVYENSRNHEQAMYFRQMGGLISAQIRNLAKHNDLTNKQITYIGKQIDMLDLDYRERKLLVEYTEKNVRRFGVPYNVWERLGEFGGDILGSAAKAYLSRGLSIGQSSDPLVRTAMENYSPQGYSKTFYEYTPMSKLK